MVSDTYTLEVLKHLHRFYPCVRVNPLTQIKIVRLVKCINDEASCFSLCRLECIPVGDAGAMYSFGFGTDHTVCAIGDLFVVYCQAVQMWERCIKMLGLVGLVYFEADEVVFPPFLVNLDRI